LHKTEGVSLGLLRSCVGFLISIPQQFLPRDMPFFLMGYIMISEDAHRDVREYCLKMLHNCQQEVKDLKVKRKTAIFPDLIDDLIRQEQTMIKTFMDVLNDLEGGDNA